MNEDSDLNDFEFSVDESSEDEPSRSDSASDSDDDAPIRLTEVWGPDVESPHKYFLLMFDHEVFEKVVV